MNARMRKTIAATAAALALGLAVPAATHAQACLGLPTMGGQMALSGGVGFPDGGKNYGATASYDLNGPLAVSGSYTLGVADAEGVDNVSTFGAGLAYDAAESSEAIPEQFSMCSMTSLSYTSIDVGGSDLSVVNIPIGLGFGTTMSLAQGGTTITPYVIPQYIWTQVSSDGESASDTFFGLSAGGTVGLGSFYAGGSVSKVFEEGTDAVMSVHAGVIF